MSNKYEEEKIKRRALSHFASKMKSGIYDTPTKAKMAAKSSVENAIFERKVVKSIPTILGIIGLIGAPFAIVKGIDTFKKNLEEAEKLSCKHVDTLDYDTVEYFPDETKATVFCTFCEREVDLIPTISEEIEEGDEPTCNYRGFKTIKWTFEGHESLDISFESEVPPIPHDLIILEKGYEATCYGPGMSDKTQCSMCGYIFNKQSLPKIDHVGIEIPMIEATCYSYGYSAGTKCKFCEKVLQEPEELPMTSHEYVTLVKEPTDTQSGGTYNECKYCGDYTIENPTEPLFKSKATYEIKDDYGRQYLVLTGVKEGVTSLEIPKSIDGIPFEEIGAEAFNGNLTITSIKLPEGMKVIGDYAFQNAKNLNYINFPSTLTKIGRFAFSDCKSLSGSVVIPSKINFIERATFYNCSGISCLNISEGVQGIEKEAFYGCSNLISVFLPSSMQQISESSVFAKCNNILEIKDVKSRYSNWPTSVVVRHTASAAQPSIFSKDGFSYLRITSSNTYYMISCELTGKEITIPSDVNGNEFYIRKGALARLTELETLNMHTVQGVSLSQMFNDNIPSTLKTINIDSTGRIETDQFANCKSLEKITISDKITYMSPAFTGCDNVKEVSLPGRYNLNYLFYNNKGIYDYSSANVYLPTKLKKVTVVGTKINEHFMYNTKYVEEVIISDSVIEIEAWAFEKCSALKKVTMPRSIPNKNEFAFSECSGITFIYK